MVLYLWSTESASRQEYRFLQLLQVDNVEPFVHASFADVSLSVQHAHSTQKL
jgi:hypothetical protein